MPEKIVTVEKTSKKHKLQKLIGILLFCFGGVFVKLTAMSTERTLDGSASMFPLVIACLLLGAGLVFYSAGSVGRWWDNG